MSLLRYTSRDVTLLKVIGDDNDILFKILFLFLERGEGRGKERERNIDWLTFMKPAIQACALTGN